MTNSQAKPLSLLSQAEPSLVKCKTKLTERERKRMCTSDSGCGPLQRGNDVSERRTWRLAVRRGLAPDH